MVWQLDSWDGWVACGCLLCVEDGRYLACFLCSWLLVLEVLVLEVIGGGCVHYLGGQLVPHVRREDDHK